MKIISEKYKEFEEVKNKLINSALAAGTFLGFLSFLSTVINAYETRSLNSNNLTDFLVLLTFSLVFFLRKRINLNIKSLFIIFGLLLLIIPDFLSYGIYSDNKVLIIVLIVFIFFNFSKKLAIWSVGIVTFSYIVLAYFMIIGYLKPIINPDIRAVSVNYWISNYFLIAIVIVAVLLMVINFSDKFIQILDNTEKKNKLIQEKENRYTEIFNSVTDAIFIHDLQGNITDVNESMIKMLKYSKDELLSMHAKMLNPDKPPYNYERFSEYVKQTMQNGETAFEWYQKDKENNFFWLEITLKKTKIGGKDRILVVARNIDKQKKALLELESYKTNLEQKVKKRTEELEAANEKLISNNEELTILNENIDYQKNIIEEKERRLNAIINNQGEGFSINDLDENFLTANIRAHEIFNVPEGKLVGRNLKDFFDENEWNRIKEQSKLRKTNVKSSYETFISLKDGTKTFLIVTGIPDYDKDGNIVGTIANFRDITERIKKENKLKELNEEFETINEELNEANEELTLQKIL